MDGDWRAGRGIPHPTGGYDDIAVSYDTVRYLRFGAYHREDGPAHSSADGFSAWYSRGRLHREDGPAVTNEDGTQEFWIRGRRVAEIS